MSDIFSSSCDGKYAFFAVVTVNFNMGEVEFARMMVVLERMSSVFSVSRVPIFMPSYRAWVDGL